MLSAGRRLQLGKTYGAIQTIPWITIFIFGKGHWLLFISVFISISLPQGTAWPYGKEWQLIYLHHSSVLLPLLSLCLAQPLGSLFLKSRHQHSCHPLFLSECSGAQQHLLNSDREQPSDLYRFFRQAKKNTADQLV